MCIRDSYNSTSTLQRDVVFHASREEIIAIAVKGTQMVKERAAAFPGKIVLEYSPESFTGTELDFALETVSYTHLALAIGRGM